MVASARSLTTGAVLLLCLFLTFLAFQNAMPHAPAPALAATSQGPASAQASAEDSSSSSSFSSSSGSSDSSSPSFSSSSGSSDSSSSSFSSSSGSSDSSSSSFSFSSSGSSDSSSSSSSSSSSVSLSSSSTSSSKVFKEPRPRTFAEVQRRNRETLERSPRWMDSDEVYHGSIFQYGLPGFARPWINLPVGDAPTIPDLLALLLTKFRNPALNYLEMGVSVGKCLFQMLEIAGPDSNITAFDLESINPSFEATLQNKEILGEVDATTKIRPKIVVSRYNKGTGRPILNYIAADEFDFRGWGMYEKYGLAPFNAIFSDAYHSGEALLHEWRIIKKQNLLEIRPDRDFFMAWDDLALGMGEAAQSIMDDIVAIGAQKGMKIETAFLNVNGWLGQNEPAHSVGVVSNLPLADILGQAGMKDFRPRYAK